MKLTFKDKTYFDSSEFKIIPSSAKEVFGWNNVKKFSSETTAAMLQKIGEWVRGVWQHAEAIAVVTLAGIGTTALLSELPFLVTLPMWIESPMVIPVIGVLVVMLLLRSSEWRANRRAKKFSLAVA